MNNLDDVIKFDTKLLIRFLKENNILKQYFKKLFFNRTDVNINNYAEWLKFIINNKPIYTIQYRILLGEKKWDLFFSKNQNLLRHTELFAYWDDEPFVLNDFLIHQNYTPFYTFRHAEGHKWSFINEKYKEYKMNYYLLWLNKNDE